MAQDFAPLLRSIWSDEDWRALSMDAQHVYLLLLSHPDRNSAGVLSLTLRKWTRLARDLSPDRLDAALTELDDAGFVVIDESTEEVLVRAFIRRATVYKHIRMMANALREASEVESDRLRSALGQELVRLPKLAIPSSNDRMAAEARKTQERLDELASMLCDAPPDGPGNGAGQDDAHGMGHGMADGIAHPHVVVAGAVVGAVAVAAGGADPSKDDLSALEGNAHARPNLALIAYCFEHPGNLRRSCRGCAADRKAESA
jgi:hypothetical protein